MINSLQSSVKCRIFIFLILMLKDSVFSAAINCDEGEGDRIVSTTNPIYYCFSRDQQFVNGIEPNVDELEVISRYGYIDVVRLEAQFASKSRALDLHLTIRELFVKKLLPHYKADPYIGSSLSITGTSPVGWFGGISMATLTFLSELMKIQDTLPSNRKMRFVGVGSGNAFFEFLLSQVGTTVATDVSPDDLASMQDMHAMLRGMQRRESFFMPVTVHVSRSGDEARIITDTFPDDDYERTTLVLNWPRKFALPYIHEFLIKRGCTILFIRKEAVDSIFDRTHLGEMDPKLPYFELRKYLAKFNKVDLPLNTATFSTVDLYWKGEQAPPLAEAIARTKAMLSK